MIIEGLVNRRQNGFGEGGTFLDVMASVSQNLRLHNGHEPVLLANYGITSQPLRVLLNAQFRRLARTNLEDCAPLGETGPGLVVLLAARAEGVEALSGGLPISPGDLHGALIDLDAGNDVVFLEDLDEWLAVGCFLVEVSSKRMTPER
ncbi:UNVERIFIED_CONTAM: hypothetical protein Sradi_2250700 [Sesamum radiatum]|uniref:Uncharacterized protein n=1 Tax=Sesamum radiatum TaxID=300843 RepID=A0AAW2T334_SESRA